MMCNDINGDGTTGDDVMCSATKKEVAGFNSAQCADQTGCSSAVDDTACCEAGFALPVFQCDWLILV